MNESNAEKDGTQFTSDESLAGSSVEALASRFWERLRLFAARRLGGEDGAEDVAQETLRHVTDAIRAGRLRQEAALPGFVFQTALHLCLQRLRSSGREARGLLRLAQSQREPETPDPLAFLIADERRSELHRALARLGEDDRELLRQMYFVEAAPDAIALRLGVTPGALRVRKHRALQRLAQLMTDPDA